jgi:HipA-like protein
MIKAFSKLSRKLLGLSRQVEVPQGIRAEFLLKYKDIPIATLSLRDAEWTFQYTVQFRHQDELRPIVEFPDVNRTYSSEALWPFFQMRIPSRSQASVERIIQSEQIQENDEAKLLSRFGRLTIANPYELVVTPQSISKSV